MEILHGFIIFLAVKVCASTDEVQGVHGSSVSLECPLTSSNHNYQWQFYTGGSWSVTITSNSKYNNANTKHLIVNDLTVSDSGTYRCTILPHGQGYVNLTVPGTWSEWGAWGDCTVACGGGVEIRIRQCITTSCIGSNSETRDCNTSPCQVPGTWSTWEAWGTCTFTCGDGQQSRTRQCLVNPCTGNHIQRLDCNTFPCPVHGNWGHWLAGPCSVTCGSGNRRRYRNCDSPAPTNGGNHCQGNSEYYELCDEGKCPVNGQWEIWGNWTPCSVTCGGGAKNRKRSCNNPPPAYSGNDCDGNNNETEACSLNNCPDKTEPSASVAPIASGVSVTVVVLVVVIIVLCIIIKRRKNACKQQEKTECNKNVLNKEAEVSFRTDNDRGGMYINIHRPSRTSSSDTDDDLNIISPQVPTDNVYHNVAIRNTISTLRVEELKDYINRTLNEGLKAEYRNVPYGLQHPTTKAQLRDNMPKNRFKTTFPYDHSRVMLDPFPGTENSDYINANFVDGFEAERFYIASQGPIKYTLQDHWRMIWQYNTRKIIMLTNLIEGAKVKCERYWPTGGKPLILGNFVLTLLSEKERAAYITREISVEDRKTKEKRSVIQYHFTAWPDHGTPDPLYLVLFHKHVRSDHNQMESGPLLVHCSAGIGRTGTFIALDALSREGQTTGFINILERLKKMRYSRMNMIQTPEQYVCLHYALLEVFTMKDTLITKDQFGKVWREIHADKRPINQQRLNEEFKMLEEKKAEHETAEYKAATSTENIEKNRSRNSLPMDNKRLYLVSFEKGRSDFINAVQAPSYTKFVGYITTQLPLPDTKVDFWTMMRDHRSNTIVLILNDPAEIDLVYSGSAESFTCGPFNLKVTKKEKRDFDITESTISISRKDEKPKEVCLYQAICKDKPDPNVLCRLVDLISTRISMSNDPVTVVSSDGAKNCGLFCAFTNAVFSMKIDEKVDIFQLVRLLQLGRPNFLSDFEEYQLCYEALNVYLESTNVYANF